LGRGLLKSGDGFGKEKEATTTKEDYPRAE
jgi:hypothetical protein